MKFIIKFLTLLLLLNIAVYSQSVNYVGTSAANFLKIGVGAKFVGSGESDITLSEDASSLAWNPGAISRIEKNNVVFSYIGWLVNTNVSYLSFVMPSDFITLGMDITYFSSGDIEETTLLRQEGTGRVFSANDLSLGFAVAKNLTDRFSVGVKVKYLREQLASVTSSAFGIDIGSVFTTSFLNDMKIGIALTNFGTSMKFEGIDLLVSHNVPGSPTGKQIPAVLDTKEWSIPLTFKIGLASTLISMKDYKMDLSYTITDSRDNDARHNIGTAMKFLDIFTIRGGYRFNYDEVTFSLGSGVELNTSFAGDISFDYAYTDFGDLKDIHQFTLGIKF
jgi:hypothetical protein